MPQLLLQPLLENAIYHGIETQPQGGTVEVHGTFDADVLCIEISNLLPPDGAPRRRPGNQMALNNVRQRLALAWPGRATLNINITKKLYRVQLRFPYENHAP